MGTCTAHVHDFKHVSYTSLVVTSLPLRNSVHFTKNGGERCLRMGKEKKKLAEAAQGSPVSSSQGQNTGVGRHVVYILHTTDTDSPGFKEKTAFLWMFWSRYVCICSASYRVRYVVLRPACQWNTKRRILDGFSLVFRLHSRQRLGHFSKRTPETFEWTGLRKWLFFALSCTADACCDVIVFRA